MIELTGTLSWDDAREVINHDVWRASINLPSRLGAGAFWIGFDEGDKYKPRLSPLRRVYFPGIIVTMADEDEDGLDKGRKLSEIAPPQEIADAIVSHLLELEEASGRYVVPVHCYQGAYRSGAVVQWMVSDLRVPEDKTSRRLIESPKKPTYNKAFLRMLRTAADKLASPSMAARIARNRALLST